MIVQSSGKPLQRKSYILYFSLKPVSEIIKKYQNKRNMGLLSDLGAILTPEESAALQPFLRQLGIRQFLLVYKKYKQWQKTTKPTIIKWGEEIQGHFLERDQDGELQLSNSQMPEEYGKIDFPLMLEYGRWMFEMTPLVPYSTECDFHEIINKIKEKYEALQSKERIALTIPTIPFLGVRNKEKEKHFDNTYTQSMYISDNHIADHIRFRTLTKNIRIRRGRTVDINVPILMDSHTDLEEIALTEPDPKFIHMDAMAFGMGICCLQCTFSTQNLDHARYMYDQMHVISPLFLALTAGTPFHKGKMADWDARWYIISGSVDCRNEQQLDAKSEKHLPTSRYSQAQLYIWPGPMNKPQYNDIKTNIKEETVQYIKESAQKIQTEIDDYLLYHLANIFKRDVLIVHQKFKEMSDEENTIFEMLNGTNWNSVRLKIPVDDNIGWRVEFRTMEIQLMADENAAYSLIIHLFTRVLHKHQILNLYIPMSLVSENFKRAHQRDAVRKEKFWFRVNIFDEGEPIIKELTLLEILFGVGEFPGLMGFIRKNLLEEKSEQEGKCCMKTINEILTQIEDFLRDIATGKRLTLAQWMRNFINQHPAYTHNSILPKKVMDDLLLTLNDISKGERKDPNFMPIFFEK